MKKKLLAMPLASAMCVGMLAGCGGGSSASTDGGDSGAGSGSGDAYNISVIVKLTRWSLQQGYGRCKGVCR